MIGRLSGQGAEVYLKERRREAEMFTRTFILYTMHKNFTFVPIYE